MGAPTLKKYLILLSVTIPSISAQHNLLFASATDSTFDRPAMTSFTIHALALIPMILSVSYEVGPPFRFLSELFDFCYEVVFPTGALISVLEGWRLGVLDAGTGTAGSIRRQYSEELRGQEKMTQEEEGGRIAVSLSLSALQEHDTLDDGPRTPRLQPETDGGCSPERTAAWTNVDEAKSVRSAASSYTAGGTCTSSVIGRTLPPCEDDFTETDPDLDEVDLQFDRHAPPPCIDGDDDLSENVEQVSICASCQSSQHGGEIDGDSDVDIGESNLRNLNYPVKKPTVEEFFEKQGCESDS